MRFIIDVQTNKKTYPGGAICGGPRALPGGPRAAPGGAICGGPRALQG